MNAAKVYNKEMGGDGRVVKKCPLVGSALSALILEDEVRLRVPVDLS